MLGGLSPVVGRFRKSLRLWREESFRFRKDVLRRIHIPVVTRSAITASPFAFGQSQSLVLVPTPKGDRLQKLYDLSNNGSASYRHRPASEMLYAMIEANGQRASRYQK